MTDPTAHQAQKPPKKRSPPYPAIPLDKAIERARSLYEKAMHHPVKVPVLASAWDYGLKSSGLFGTTAALKQFGLLDDEGAGEKRAFKLTSRALRIVRDPDPTSEKRLEAIKHAALEPKIHAELWSRYGEPLLAGSLDVAALSYLTVDRAEAGEAPYYDKAASELLDEFKKTAAFARLADSGGVSSEDEEKGDGPSSKMVKPGDLIQWTGGGVDQFAKPAKVLELSDCGEWVFTDQGASAIPIKEVTVIETPPGAPTPPPTPPHILAALEAAKKADAGGENTPIVREGFRKAVFPLDDDCDVTLIFPKSMTRDQLEDLDSYLNVFLGKEKKKAPGG